MRVACRRVISEASIPIRGDGRTLDNDSGPVYRYAVEIKAPGPARQGELTWTSSS